MLASSLVTLGSISRTSNDKHSDSILFCVCSCVSCRRNLSLFEAFIRENMVHAYQWLQSMSMSVDAALHWTGTCTCISPPPQPITVNLKGSVEKRDKSLYCQRRVLGYPYWLGMLLHAIIFQSDKNLVWNPSHPWHTHTCKYAEHTHTQPRTKATPSFLMSLTKKKMRVRYATYTLDVNERHHLMNVGSAHNKRH